ncbi:hypothetical protein [Streptomyces sp. NPDC007088]|uniref:hypothetical protein n=1 Tax=Streptomyces sp. NPDC007088 TaxID=3364773 RepID=UPI0036832A77
MAEERQQVEERRADGRGVVPGEAGRASSSLSAVLRDATREIARALEVVPGNGSFALSHLLRPDDPHALVAVRVLGADALVPYRLAGHVPVPEDSLLVGRVLDAFPSGPGGSEVSRWRHHGLVQAARAVLPTGGGAEAADLRVSRAADIVVPDAAWVREAAPARLPHLAAQLAALAVPGAESSPLGAELDARAADLAYGFEEAVDRGDWRRAAGAGRWLALLPGAPSGPLLDEGTGRIRRGAGDDPWVLLQVTAAHLLRDVRT